MVTTQDLEALLRAKEIVVCCGSGGVGKTSVAAAIALGASERLGAKVLVVTVDPAKRLATALGLEALGNVERRVAPELLAAAGLSGAGELWGAMLDTKQSWDALVMRHAPDEQTALRILSNRLYTNLTARFVQSHDYIAMERLYELHASGRYDLIVVDTPPTRNAVDFLDAPERMAEFFGGRLLRWLTLPYRVGGKRGARMVNVASKPFYQIADRLLGSRFLEEIAEFFLNFQSMYDGFVERARAVEALLHDRRSTFVVVTTLESAPLHEGERFCAELTTRELDLGALVLNRTLPDYFRAPEALRAALGFDEHPAAVAAAVADIEPGLDREQVERVTRTVANSFQRFAGVARLERTLRDSLQTTAGVVCEVPSREDDIADVAGLAWIAAHLFDSDGSVSGTGGGPTGGGVVAGGARDAASGEGPAVGENARR